MGVFLHHPETEATIETTDINGDCGEAQAEMYETRGWVRVDAERPAFGDGPPVVVDPEEPAVVDLQSLDEDEIVDLAVEHDIDVSKAKDKDELVAAIAAHSAFATEIEEND